MISPLDFPIDGSKGAFVARRDFAEFLVLASGAFVVGQGRIAALPPPARGAVAAAGAERSVRSLTAAATYSKLDC